jgi:outer membrane protein TolC
VGLKQKFPWFGTLKARKSVEAARARAKHEAFQSAKRKLYFDVKETYYKLYILQRQEALLRENLSWVRTHKNIANMKFESGEGSMVDVLRANMEIAELQNTLAKVEDRRVPLTEEFSSHLNQPVDTGAIALPDTLRTDTLAMSKQALMDSIIDNNEGLQQLDQQRTMWEHKQEAAKKGGMPSISLGLNYINTAQRTDMDVPENGKDVFFPQVGISLPIYRSRYKAIEKEAALQEQSVQQQKENKRNELEVQLEKAWQDYRDAGRKIELYEAQINRARRAMSLLSTDYSSAGSDFEELIRMERKILQYGFRLAEARVDRNMAVAMMRYLASME